MRVLLKLELDCDADTAWDAIRSPHVLGDVSAPLVTFASREPGGFPELWDAGDHPVRVRAFGVLPLGDQMIGISFPTLRGVRAMRDTGRGLSGPLSVIDTWEHTLTVAPLPGSRTLYRDQLRFRAGALTFALWPLYWAFWQWRGLRLRSVLARRAQAPGRSR